MFAVLSLVLCLVPFVGMLSVDDSALSDDDSRSVLPVLQDEDGLFNLTYLSNLGDYFEDHFAYRSLAIDLNARLRAGVFKTSPTDQVIVGRDGWLFYGNTLSDFRATAPLSEREILNITHNLSLMQGYTNAMGAEFVVVIAPNKNTLYGSYMPYYYPGAYNHSMSLLMASLDAEGVNYVDLFELFGAEDKVLYYRTDTHWNTEGAFLVTNAVLDACNRGAAAGHYDSAVEVITGDLERMLYPITAGTEEAPEYSAGTWQFSAASVSVEDDIVTTSSLSGEGTLLMFRDSFANTLIPFLATEFARAEFSKMVPYNLTRIADLKPDVVIIERAERHIDLLGSNPPFMYAPTAELRVAGSFDTGSGVSWHQDGDFRVLEGFVDEEYIEALDTIFVSLESRYGEQIIYVPFQISIVDLPLDINGLGIAPISSQYGFRLFLDERSLPDVEYTIKVIVAPANGDAAYVVRTATLIRR